MFLSKSYSQLSLITGKLYSVSHPWKKLKSSLLGLAETIKRSTYTKLQLPWSFLSWDISLGTEQFRAHFEIMQKPAVLAWGSKEQGWNQQAIIWLVSQTTHAYDVLERWLFHEILQCSKIEKHAVIQNKTILLSLVPYYRGLNSVLV